MAGFSNPSPSPLGTGNSWLDLIGKGKPIPQAKVTPSAPSRMANSLATGLGLSGAGNFSTVDPGGIAATSGAARKKYLTTLFPAAPAKANNSTFTPSNYGAGAAGSAAGKALTVKPSDVAALINASNGATGGAAAGGTTKAPSALTDLLRVPGLEDIYNPILKQLEDQAAATSKRYEANQANLANIFGALSGLAAKDKLNIQEQYAQSLASASTALNERTTAANEATAAGVAQAQATGAERGMGPGMATNPIQTATAEGNARATEYQTVWDGLQRANEAQAIADTESRGAGYNQQKIAAISGLQQSLEDRLMEIGGNTAQVQSDIAKAKFGQESNIAQAKYAEAVAARNAAAAAANAQASAAAKAAAKLPAVDKIRNAIGAQRFNALNTQLNNAYGRAWAGKNPVGATGKPVPPNASDVMAEWLAQGGNKDLLNEATTLAKNTYNK